MKINMLSFVWLIIFITYSCDASSDSDDSGEGLFGGDFEADVFNRNPLRFFRSGRCPCQPNGVFCDILATCERAAGDDPLQCLAGVLGPVAFGFCGGDRGEEDDFLDFLFAPVFGATGPLLGPLGICVSSPQGLAGLIRAIIGFIIELIDAFDDCDFDRRRLQGELGTNPSNPFHGRTDLFEGFVELIEYHGTDGNELYNMVMKEGGIAHLAAMMKQKMNGFEIPEDVTADISPNTSPNRRLLSRDSGEDRFGICDFGFLRFIARFLRRRRLQEVVVFDPATDAFESLLATLFTNADCDNNRDGTPILCIINDAMNRGVRRRLDSGDSGDSGDGDDDQCCGDLPTQIQLTLGDQGTLCGDNVLDAFNCLENFVERGDCDLR